MRFSILAALVGFTTAATVLPPTLKTGGTSTTTTTTYTSSSSSTGAGGLSTSVPLVSVGGGSGALTGVSDLYVSSSGSLGKGSGVGGGVGSGAVIVTSGSTGASNIVTGGVITDGNFPKANLGAISGSSSSLVNNNVVASGVIGNAIANTSTVNVSIDSLFSKLPSSAQIDSLILSADSVAILKTIQAVATETSLTCDQRIAYLLELLGRLRAAVQKKTFAADQLKIVVDTAAAEIIRLQGLIDANVVAIGKLGIDDLKKRLDDFTTQLQTAYAEYNKVQSQIPVLEAQVAGSEQQITILTKNSDNERNRISNDKLKLGEVSAEIANLQAKLKSLLDQQAVLNASVSKGEANIAKNEQSIAAIRIRIDDLSAQIRTLTDQSDTLSSQTKDLEVKTSRLRTDINVADAKKAKLLRDNANFQDSIALQKKKNIPEDLTKLRDMVTTLQKLVPTVEGEIDRHYYYCFGDGKVEVKNTGGVVVYIVRGEAFGNYLRNLYGRNVVVPAVNGNVLFNRVDIFGQSWSGAFGYPFGSGAFVGTDSNDLSLTGSFSCLNPGAIVTGSGTITAIGSNYLESADSSGQKQRLSLGSCSRLESTKTLPAVGQKFYWSGVPAAQGFNLYSGSCFE